MKKKVVTGIMLTLLLICMLTLAFDIQPIQGIDGFKKILILEDDFEDGIANWWNGTHGTPTVSSDVAHSGNYSYVTDEDYDSMEPRWNTSIIGEMEVWFYDNMSTEVESIVATSWNTTSYHFGVVMWHGGDYDQYYA